MVMIEAEKWFNVAKFKVLEAAALSQQGERQPEQAHGERERADNTTLD